MRVRLALLLCVIGGPLFASEPPIRFPVVEPRVPVVPLDTPVTLTPETLYVLDSDVPLIVLSSPPGLVRVTAEEGPLRIRGVFVDAKFPGRVESRTYRGKHIYTVDATDKNGPCELLVIPVGVKSESEVIRRPLIVGNGVRPSPNPNPQPQPPPAPSPNPPEPPIDNSPAKLVVLIVEETAESAANRGALFADRALSARMAEKMHRWRIVDKDVVGPDGRPPADVARFLELAKGKKLPQLFLVDENGKTRLQSDLPLRASGLLELITKYGG